MIKFNKGTKTIIVVGTGGVGKTTTAAAISTGLACAGFKVLVVTIDPSLRLAQAIGFKPNGIIQKIEIDSKYNLKSGELYASTVNHEIVFQYFLTQAMGSKSNEIQIKKITENRLFKQLSTKLSRSQDFTTLFYLYTQSISKKYDYIVLDTPPAEHTWTFLKAPAKLSALFNSEILVWFTKTGNKPSSFFSKILKQGTEKAFDILKLLTGSEFFNELKLFFEAIQNWQTPIQNTIAECQKLLMSIETEFVLITNFDQNKFKDSLSLSRKIYNEGYNLSHMIINLIPDWTDEKSNEHSDEIENYRKLYKQTMKTMLDQISDSEQHLKVYKSMNLSQNINHAEMYTIYKNIEKIN